MMAAARDQKDPSISGGDSQTINICQRRQVGGMKSAYMPLLAPWR